MYEKIKHDCFIFKYHLQTGLKSRFLNFTFFSIRFKMPTKIDASPNKIEKLYIHNFPGN